MYKDFTVAKNSVVYNKFADIANILSQNIPHEYTVKNVLIDFDNNWYLTTIIDCTIGIQVLSIQDWIDIVYNNLDTNDIIDRLIKQYKEKDGINDAF